MSSLMFFNVSESSVSPFYTYLPNRDGDASLTWNSSYTESVVWPPLANQQEPAGIPYRRTLAGSASMSFTYYGTDVYLCLTGGGAAYNFTVDGQVIIAKAPGTDDACSGYSQADTLLYSTGISMGNHLAQLNLSSSGEEDFRFYGGVVTMGITSDSIHVAERVVDDTDSHWSMFPGRGTSDTWQTGHDLPNAGFIANTHSYTCIYNQGAPQKATYTFTGAGGVILRGTLGMGFQVYAITLNGDNIPLDATSVWPYPQGVNLFLRGGLDPKKQYTISLTNWNENYPTCDKLYYLPSSQPLLACCANLDGLVLLGGHASSPSSNPNTDTIPTLSTPTSKSRSTSTSDSRGSSPSITKSAAPSVPRRDSKLSGRRIAGACIGAMSVVTLLMLVAFVLLKRMRKRRLDHRTAPIPPPTTPPETTSTRDDKLRALTYALNLGDPDKMGMLSAQPVGGESEEPFGVMSESRAGATATGHWDGLHRIQSRLAPADLEEILQFVSRRMDSEQRQVWHPDPMPFDERDDMDRSPPDYRD